MQHRFHGMRTHRHATSRSVVALALALTVSPAAGLILPNSAEAASCHAIEFVGVHGVGEEPLNMGPTVHDTYQKFQTAAQTSGVDVTDYPVPYQKVTIFQLLKQTTKAFPNVQEGVKLLSDHLTTQATDCPNQREALVGYSEGAWIISKFLQDAPSDLTGHVSAVVLYGDPEFDHTATGFVALSTDGDGVARRFGFGTTPYLPQSLSGRAISYCLSEQQTVLGVPRTGHDPVCNSTSSNIWDLHNCLKKDTSSCVHFHYREGGVTQRGADFLGGLLLPATGKEVFVSNDRGGVQVFTDVGNTNLQLDTLIAGTGGYETGMTFDSSSNLYVTDFDNGSVTKFASARNPATTFATGLVSPESIVRDGSGNFYVGSADAAVITKLSSSGSVIDTYAPIAEDRGADWIDLAGDGCTMAYTSEGTIVQRFDVCGNTQLTPLASSLPGTRAYAVRLLPGGGALVADSETIVRVGADGNVLANYDAPGDDQWFALTLDPRDAGSFWAGDASSGDVIQFDILTGSEITHFNAGPGTVYGLAVQ
ncbi:MAG: cutinase family protein [Actinomycetota bacterium]|nr:cutinase family protein [Actinomycetota bacterium]